ncbi:hypothetical protein [Marinomonas rhodophyticola]
MAFLAGALAASLLCKRK